MKHLTDNDIDKMADGEFTPDYRAVNRAVRGQLKLGTLIPAPDAPHSDFMKIDLHNHTVEQAWDMVCHMAQSGVRDAVVITGASGILKIKFQQWARDSVISDRFISITPLNNGSFAVKFHRLKRDF